MPALTITFSAPLNVSCQIGDTAYYTDTTSAGPFTIDAAGATTLVNSSILEIGPISAINNPTSSTPSIVVDSNTLPTTLNGLSFFILFSKDNKANLSSILGYYANVKFVNTSEEAAEMFSVGVDIFASSK